MDDDDDDEAGTGGKSTARERRKIEIRFIQDKSRRHITFSKRKAGIMKKAYELSVLTGTQVLLLVVSETGLVYTFTTPKLQPLVTKPEGKNLIQACLNAPEESNGADEDEPQSSAPTPPPQQQQQQQPHPDQVAYQQQQHHLQQQQQAAAAAAAAAYGAPPVPGAQGYGGPVPGNDNTAAYQQYFNQMQNQAGNPQF
ncbi:hypothetical protein BABINDRAFT_32918 [Babjeviella inositovora NRRL Y-12698]|uniref:MADS-box domain-containing protein n=1 Tax=Babjeviella inositovora NRRL Y-12698 TaxID=984486 RepID=A0A1E3QWR7_9ASCO|nr:uncharacterized protein BABINDRAFT_32918 [Babjeviella inositovora NRRL Y-12698]ODQ82139.1 hypothetical protein BABINDRAFT_32918 [Babjeviella inositovora NRRL Y-12698]